MGTLRSGGGYIVLLQKFRTRYAQKLQFVTTRGGGWEKYLKKQFFRHKNYQKQKKPPLGSLIGSRYTK